MKKHAYLIMSHMEFHQVAKLVMLIDNEKNDIYLHIDKKVKNADIIFRDKIKPVVNKSNIYLIPQNNVQWGGYSQIKTELDLLKAAIPQKYQYYHLLSGADLPLKSQEYIHHFFENNKGKEFVQLGTEEYIKNTQQRYRYYWIFQEQLGNGRKNFLYKILNKLRYGTVFIQSCLGIDRRKKTTDVFKYYYSGAQWFSITHDFAIYVVSKENIIQKIFDKTICCDEVFLQTIIMNSPFKDNIYHEYLDGDYIAIMRKIDWNRGNPYTWLQNDYDELINSEFLFARKFSESIDNVIIDKIFNKIINK